MVAIEPQPHAHPFINATLVLNGWQARVRVVHAAVSDDAGTRVKMVNRHGWGNWDVTEMAGMDDPAEGDEVPAVQVDDLVDEVRAFLRSCFLARPFPVFPSPTAGRSG